MDMDIKEKFLALWEKYFNNAELPITFYYTDEPVHAKAVKPESGPRCVIGALVKVREGQSLAFDGDAVGCPGGKRYLGFTEGIMPDFEYFLSCGIPGKLEGERYKKTPEMVKEFMEKYSPAMKAPAKYIVFKRWDKLENTDNPEVVICFARPDVLSGLFTLASFDEAEQNTVIAPFGSGCSSIVQHPYLEVKSPNPKGVIGMFDVSARPYVPADMLTFSTPMSKFVRMIYNMEESFLITPSWAKVQKRIK
ncbi:MAG: DUF169 domain-containing protein [Dehalococcoidales bacterium]|nr:DUF169 domain-containing protein [Dehalococcoidales bacterium]